MNAKQRLLKESQKKPREKTIYNIFNIPRKIKSKYK